MRRFIGIDWRCSKRSSRAIMTPQLIVTILGTDQTGILSEIAKLVSENQCNILDSRQAVYGKEFSLTMIIEGSQPAITRVECSIPTFCQQFDLLSMMKRTSQHEKQNLEVLLDVEFSGVDAAGLISTVSSFFATRSASISAFRQKTFPCPATGNEMMRCKLVVNVPQSGDIEGIADDFNGLLGELGLEGKITVKHQKDSHEHASSW